jgi:hypothetical protein
MTEDYNQIMKSRIEKIKILTGGDQGSYDFFEAGGLALAVLSDTVGSGHPLLCVLDNALKTKDYMVARSASRSVVTLYEEGGLKSPRLSIAHEIEGNFLDIAQAQVQSAETCKDVNQKQVLLAISAFLAGATLEDALRRLCDSNSISYDVTKTSISKLQSGLYQPSKNIEIITASENKQITVWGDTRNKADHGRFSDITHTEVVAMVLGIRSFLDKHLP